jgi:putative ABC transport system permease protein
MLAFVIIYALLPLYNNLSGKHLLFSPTNGNIWLVIASAILGSLALSSIYPALLLSSFKPLSALKGKLSFGIANASFRKTLVVAQFIFSVGLIIGTIVIANQLRYVREKNLGFNRQFVFSFSLKGSINDHQQAVREQLLKQPGILNVTSSSNNVLGEYNSTGDTYWDGKQEGRTFLIHTNFIDKHFIPLLQLQLAEGKNFTGSKSDSSHFILNEAAVKQAGIKNPVGKSFTLWQNKGTIIGVVKDFNYASLRKNIEPAIFCYSSHNSLMFVRTTGRDAAKAIAATQKIWKSYGSEYPFTYSFLDDEFNKMYQADQRQGVLFNVFAMVAIIISCLGLLGLATYTANVRTKEIGVRKVLGASVTGITNLLVKEFVALVLIALIIAAPITWWLMNKWLQDFVYRINISWWMFGLAGVSVLFIALLTVGLQAIKAAVANPVKSLRTE